MLQPQGQGEDALTTSFVPKYSNMAEGVNHWLSSQMIQPLLSTRKLVPCNVR